MNPFGSGSDGTLNVTSGTANLLLNRKYEFENITVASGATLSTSSSTGAVLYLCARDTIRIDGTINVSNKVNRGNNSWSVTIDGVTYTSPGVAQGANGGWFTSQGTWASQSNGFGGGGEGGGVSYNGTEYDGGLGGNGSTSPSGGGAVTVSRTTNGTSANRRNANATNGGSGVSFVKLQKDSGINAKVVSTGGAGGAGYGANGQNGSGSWNHSGSGSLTYNWFSGGGGGAGGAAGRAGVHVVLKAPKVIINGQIITSGTDGGNGGNGGRNRNWDGYRDYWGAPGGGGGGGNAGETQVVYAIAFENNGTYAAAGGDGGNSGIGGSNNGYTVSDGSPGANSSQTVNAVAPIVSFTQSATTIQHSLDIQFTNQSLGATSYLWDFGDSTTSTATNPNKAYSAPGTYTVTLTATNDKGSKTATQTITVEPRTFTLNAPVTMKMGASLVTNNTFYRNASVSMGMGADLYTIIIKDTSPLAGKKYLYKVYDEDGTYIGTWDDPIDEPEFTREINSLGSSMTVELARNSDSMAQSVGTLETEDDETIQAEDDRPIYVTTMSRSKVGEGSSVRHNNRVDVYAYYGATEPLTTEAGEPITTEDGEELMVELGAPNGRRIFTGFISDINIRYGSPESTVVTLDSFGWDLDQFLLTDAGKTTVAYNSTDPSDIARDVIDKFNTENPGYALYTTRSSSSIELTSTVASYTFRNNTYAEALKKSLELMPGDWYYRVGLGDNTVYFAQKSALPQHLFFLKKHIINLDLRSYISNSTNDVIFTGGGEPSLFKRYTETRAPRTRRVLHKYSDNRVTLPLSAQLISESILERDNEVQYRTTIDISAGTYDIETIDVGQSVSFRNFDNYVDGLVFQIVGLNYNPDSVQIQLDTLPPDVNKRLADIQRNLTVEENANVPDSPS